jgi:DNA-binding NarL/FixJ family response regulator
MIDDEKLLQLHDAGMNAAEIAAELGVTTRTVGRHRARLGLSRPAKNGGFRVTPEWKARVEALLDDGCSIREAARTMECRKETVSRHFPGRGWTYREGGEFRRDQRLIEMKGKL